MQWLRPELRTGWPGDTVLDTVLSDQSQHSFGNKVNRFVEEEEKKTEFISVLGFQKLNRVVVPCSDEKVTPKR